MDFTVLDLEWNGAYSPRQDGFVNEIIEFGAVNAGASLEPVAEYSALVRPQIGKKLSGRVEELTSLSASDLQGGAPFLEAFEGFLKFLGDRVLLTWGPCDVRALIENYSYYKGSVRLPMKTQFADLQAYCQHCLGAPKSQQIGLSAAAERLGIDCAAYALHRATGDSLLALACFQAVYDPVRFAPFLEPTDDDFYRKMIFKNVFLTDIENPLVDRSKMGFLCPQCQKKARRVSKWTVKNKQFSARFHCRACQRFYAGKVQFKLRYDGVQVKKSIRPEAEASAGPTAKGMDTIAD